MLLALLLYSLLEYLSASTASLNFPLSTRSQDLYPTPMDPNLLDMIVQWEMLFEGPSFGEATETEGEASYQAARALVVALKRQPEAKDSLQLCRWLNLVASLQRAAYHDPDNGSDAEMASWCEMQWHDIRHSHPDNFVSQQGLGYTWLLKSQKTLARIYRREGSPSASSTSSFSHLGVPRRIATDAEDSARINSEDYVEARTLLTPSIEFFDKARDLAQAQGPVCGKLLEQSAEAYMSMGNVSHPRSNELCYQKALKLLRQASEIDGYEMDPYLQAFLQESIDYIE